MRTTTRKKTCKTTPPNSFLRRTHPIPSTTPSTIQVNLAMSCTHTHPVFYNYLPLLSLTLASQRCDIGRVVLVTMKQEKQNKHAENQKTFKNERATMNDRSPARMRMLYTHGFFTHLCLFSTTSPRGALRGTLFFLHHKKGQA